MMDAIFLKLLNMSITAGYLILAVMLLRLLLSKAPRAFFVVMWAFVGIRLVCPFSVESIFSLIPSAEPVPESIAYDPVPSIHSGIQVFNSAVNPILQESFTPTPGASVNPMQVVLRISAIVWAVGVAIMLVYCITSYLNIHRRVREAVHLKDCIWVCDHISSPFILGLFRPKIYLPSNINAQDMEYVLAHEHAHLKRRDHWWKPLGFALLAVYWFNPLIWLAYILLCRDIERACDEKVLKQMGGHVKKPYSEALLNCSIKPRMIAACPLAFGEVGVKKRIKSVLNYKKPTFWIILVALVLCILLVICLLTNPRSGTNRQSSDPKTTSNSSQSGDKYNVFSKYLGLDASNGLDVYVWQMHQESYCFALLPHSEEPLHFLSEELMNLPGATAYEMRQILLTYGSEESSIYIIPWQNPLSSYIADIWIIDEKDNNNPEKVQETLNAKREAYISKVKTMLLGSPESKELYAIPVYNEMTFDIDADGISEKCTIRPGLRQEYSYDFVINIDFQNGSSHYAVFTVVDETLEYGFTKDDNNNVFFLIKDDTTHQGFLYEITFDQDIFLKGDMEDINSTPILVYKVNVDLFWPKKFEESIEYDIDHDGILETCCWGYGPTSGVSSYEFSAWENGNLEYFNAFVFSDHYYISFDTDNDNVVFLQGNKQWSSEEGKRIDISVENGNFELSIDGQPLGIRLGRDLNEVPVIHGSENGLQYASTLIYYRAVESIAKTRPSLQALSKIVQLEFIKKTADGYSTVFNTEKGYVEFCFDKNGDFITMRNMQMVIHWERNE